MASATVTQRQTNVFFQATTGLTDTRTGAFSPYSTYTTSDPLQPNRTIVAVQGFVEIEVPLTCENLEKFDDNIARGTLGPDPDVAGLGILLAFLITACAGVLLAITAYTSGCLSDSLLRPVDRHVVHAHSRNRSYKWQTIITSITLAFNDQQLVTGLTILIAGFHGVVHSNLAIYHWNTLVSLAWLSSSVHIASLALLREYFNQNPTLRNIRVAGMLLLLTLLLIAMWPLRHRYITVSFQVVPTKCVWSSESFKRLSSLDSANQIDRNWILSVIMLLVAYTWKLSQLFAHSRGWLRRYLVAHPEAAIERMLRRILLANRSRWLKWPAYKMLSVCYITLVVYIELAVSFIATILYLCLTLPYGIVGLFYGRALASNVASGEGTFTFGQLVPLLLLGLPILSFCELYIDIGNKDKDESTICRLMIRSLRRTPETQYRNLASALRLNELASVSRKMRYDDLAQPDPIITHLVHSKAFQFVVWTFVAAITGIGLAVVILASGAANKAAAQQAEDGPIVVRYHFLMDKGLPVLIACVPVASVLVLLWSRRLQ